MGGRVLGSNHNVCQLVIMAGIPLKQRVYIGREPDSPGQLDTQTMIRYTILKLVETKCLEALKHGLETDDPALVQGYCVFPDNPRHQPESACAICYAGWKGLGLKTVEEVQAYFGSINSINHNELYQLVSWYDRAQRRVMRKTLLQEIDSELKERCISKIASQS